MKLFRALINLMLLALLAAGGFAAWLYHELRTPVHYAAAGQPLVVAKGERLDQILSDLKTRGIISHVLPVRLYLKLSSRQPLVQAGNYYFTDAASPLQVLDKLEQGGQFDRITVIEGWNRWDIADALSRLPALQLKDRAAALKILNDARYIVDIDPNADSLEGYLFPDTYFVVANTGARDVILDMVNRFKQVWDEKLQEVARRNGISIHQAVTMASIIETEAKLKSERPIIASVIINRLHHNMPLGVDSTLVYASKMAGAWKNDGKVYQSDIDRDSPYNTRKKVGLPPGPVGCPGLSSLEAAVSPAQTDYLYYVRNPDRNDGAHNFYADEKGFAEGVQALRAWEQKQHDNSGQAPAGTN
jgi:UPF0755 protein